MMPSKPASFPKRYQVERAILKQWLPGLWERAVVGEEILEGVAMLLAAGVLTWMIFWMQRQARNICAELEADVRRAVTVGSRWALFGLAFV